MATREYTLDNGLTLIAREMHHAPVSAFFVWYRVGGRNEVPGVTGISHWTEHMMFKGTPRYGKGQLDRIVSNHGGLWNGFTTEDFTAYFEVLPAEHLDLSLDIESDRMVNCLFDPEEVRSERTVIISEREGGENSPEFWLDEAVTRIAFLVHPYGQGVIGAKSDLTRITRDDLFKHYRAYYAPNNAVAVAAGDFAADEVYEKVKRYFGGIPEGLEPPEVRSVELPQEGERRVVIRRPGGAKYGIIAFHAPGAKETGIYAALVLDAILSGGKAPAGWGGRGGMGRSSRLYKALVMSGIASAASSYMRPGVDPSLLQVDMTLRDGVETERAEEATFRVLSALIRDKLPEEELEKAKKQVRAQVAYNMESAQNNALALGMWEVLSSWKEADQVPERIESVTADEVQDAAGAVLREDNRTIGWFIPEGPAAGKGGSSDGAGGLEGKAAYPSRIFFCKQPRAQSCRLTSAPAGRLPGPGEIKRKVLPNGLTALAYKNPWVGFTAAQALVDAGGFASGQGKEGIARFCAICLIRGTKKRSASEINEFTDKHGMSLVSSARMDAAVVSITSLDEDAEKALELLGEALMEPVFPDNEIERLKGETVVALRQSEKDTATSAEKTFAEAVFPESHPYHGFALGTETSVSSITAEDLQSFHKTFYSPGHTIVAAVSNREPEEVFSWLERVFGRWTAVPEASEAAVARERRDAGVRQPKGADRRFVFIPGKTQCDVALGFPCLSRNDPDYARLTVMNMVLGQMGLGGRIGHNVRDKQGLAYYAYSGLRESKGPGAWVVRAGVNPRSVEKAVSSVLDEIRRLQSAPCSDQELSDVKGFVIGHLPLSIETSRALVATMLEEEYFGLGRSYLEEFAGRVNAVTKDDVLQMARKHLSADNYVLVVTGPEPPE